MVIVLVRTLPLPKQPKIITFHAINLWEDHTPFLFLINFSAFEWDFQTEFPKQQFLDLSVYLKEEITGQFNFLLISFYASSINLLNLLVILEKDKNKNKSKTLQKELVEVTSMGNFNRMYGKAMPFYRSNCQLASRNNNLDSG